MYWKLFILYHIINIMGQRSFRGQLIDSLQREYLTSNKEKSSKKNLYNEQRLLPTSHIYSSQIHGFSFKSNGNDVIGKEQMIDVEFDFDLGNPLLKIIEPERVKMGIVNYLMEGNKKIMTLKLNLQNPLKSNEVFKFNNLQILFGIYFLKDIPFINFTIKDFEHQLVDNRIIIKDILEYMVFKSDVRVVINNKFIYHIHPGDKDTSIVLLYSPQVNNNEIENKNYIKDFICHEYNEINSEFSVLQSYKIIINQLLFNKDKHINNSYIIIPKIKILSYQKDKAALQSFLNYLSSKFKKASIEFIFNEEEETDTYSLIRDNQEILKQFEYIIITFYINKPKPVLPNNAHLLKRNIYIPEVTNDLNLNKLTTLLQKLKLEKVLLGNLIKSQIMNEETGLFDRTTVCNYTYFNRLLNEKCQLLLFTLSKSTHTKKLKSKKPILNNLFEFCFGSKYRKMFYIKDKEEYFYKTVKNRQIITF